MLELWKGTKKIDFVGMFTPCAIVSIVLVIASLILVKSSMKSGIDFAGGAEVQVKFDTPVAIDQLRTQLKNSNLAGITVQSIGSAEENEYLIKVSSKNQNLNELEQKVETSLAERWGNIDIRKVDIVGPKAGAALRWKGFQAMLWAFIAIMIYIGLRFDFKYSPGAIVALFHDVSIILGLYALLGVEFTLQTVAALLAVIGYSVNDTVVVYDRVRESEQKRGGFSLGEHINTAVNQTLTRTFLTSTTTLFVSIIMWIFGGEAIRNFFTAITFGVLIGTYSSIFVASPVTLLLNRWWNKDDADDSSPLAIGTPGQ